MIELTHVYVFISDNRQIRGLSVLSNGSNIPAVPGVAVWEKCDETSMTTAALAKYAKDPQNAMANLIMRGYHLSRIGAQIICFPAPHRST